MLITPPRAVMTVVLIVAIGCSGSPTAPARLPQPTSSMPPTCAGVVGVNCFGTLNYVEYIPGDVPVVISVPHGGALTPATIPNRTTGTTVTDTNTIELGHAITQAFLARTGRRPHLVLVHLLRTKLDANREVVEAAQGNPDAIRAWTEYHTFIELAMAAVRQRSGTGLYVDLHGHGHAKARLELGYLLTAETLNGTDDALNAAHAASASSLRLLASPSSVSSAGLIRGPMSLGGFLEAQGPSVPSP
ncbi:MAG: N-formylglutamate amidohydrolase, partial [Acidobacteria bacterium]|nr:N-formylglutamate amidohydrolase [Acidobacteriota bacterium]